MTVGTRHVCYLVVAFYMCGGCAHSVYTVTVAHDGKPLQGAVVYHEMCAIAFAYNKKTTGYGITDEEGKCRCVGPGRLTLAEAIYGTNLWGRSFLVSEDRNMCIEVKEAYDHPVGVLHPRDWAWHGNRLNKEKTIEKGRGR